MFRTILVAMIILLSACSIPQRLSEVGRSPDMQPVSPTQTPRRERSIGMPMPYSQSIPGRPNSLWRTGARAFFKDQRASRVGDILTVEIDINDSAQVDNSTTRSRTSDEDANLSAFLGFEGELGRILPDGFNPDAATNFGSTSTTQGQGAVDRQEVVNLTVAAVIVDVLPNGNFVIQGRQEVRVNFELRELLIAGVVRPEDISSTNRILHTQIAEARISYGGRGQITDVQQPRYGQQVYDIIFPF